MHQTIKITNGLPVLLLKKRDSNLRPVQDYRKLDEITIKNWYPLPLILELKNELRNARYFMKLDSIGVQQQTNPRRRKWKVVFRTNQGLFEPMVMFFGLANSPTTFQKILNNLLRIKIHDRMVIIYIKNILIYHDDLDEHYTWVKHILKIWEQSKLYLKPGKCKFEVKEVEYLSVIVGKGEIQMDPIMVKGLTEWLTPENYNYSWGSWILQDICERIQWDNQATNQTHWEQDLGMDRRPGTSIQEPQNGHNDSTVLWILECTWPMKVECVRCDMGHPQVKFLTPTPTLVNTVPIQVWVRVNREKLQVYFKPMVLSRCCENCGLQQDNMEMGQ